jgi:hypothetical protein
MPPAAKQVTLPRDYEGRALYGYIYGLLSLLAGKLVLSNHIRQSPNLFLQYSLRLSFLKKLVTCSQSDLVSAKSPAGRSSSGKLTLYVAEAESRNIFRLK